MTIVGVPAPSILAPILLRQLATSAISGSQAAFFKMVSPSASVAAIITLCVAPTETFGKFTTPPCNPFGAFATT